MILLKQNWSCLNTQILKYKIIQNLKYRTNQFISLELDVKRWDLDNKYVKYLL